MRLGQASLALTVALVLTATTFGEPASTQTKASQPATLQPATKESAATQTIPPGVAQRGAWLVEETENFSICYPLKRYDPATGIALEKARTELQAAWLPANADTRWRPKCQIVLHASAAGYLQAVGRGAQATSGSALVDFDQGRISARKIDIRGDRADWFSAALTHELTHVVLADRFISVAIPHWADEGMAILADTPDKQDRHAVDLREALGGRSEFRLAELLSLGGYPHPTRMGAFYGQSASLVDYLTTIGTREQLVTMVERATTEGYDVALREIYSIESVRHLERDWRQHLASDKTAAASKAKLARPKVNQTAATIEEKTGPAVEVTGAAAME